MSSGLQMRASGGTAYPMRPFGEHLGLRFTDVTDVTDVTDESVRAEVNTTHVPA